MRLFNVINAAEMAMYGFVGSRITAHSGRRTSCACFMVRTALGVLGFAAIFLPAAILLLGGYFTGFRQRSRQS